MYPQRDIPKDCKYFKWIENIHTIFKAFLPLSRIYYCIFLLENLKILKSWEHIKGAKKPVKKTSAKIFLTLGIKIKELISE